MQSRSYSVLTVVGAPILFFQLSSCSMIGLYIGSRVDASKPNRMIVQNYQIRGIKPGTTCYLLLKNKTQLSGRMTGIVQIPEDEYAQKFARSRADHPELSDLPAPGDSIVLNYNSEGPLKGRFLFYDFDYLVFRPEASNRQSYVNLRTFSSIRKGQEKLIPADTLRILIAVRRIPLKSAIAIREGNATTEIPLDDVVQIERKVGKHGKLIGFLVGAAADVTIVAVATSNMNFFPDNFSLLGK